MIFQRCTRCRAVYLLHNNDAGWRWTGSHWEHACADAPPQAGHFRAEPTRLEDLLDDARADADREWLAAVRGRRGVLSWCEAAGCQRLATLCDDRGGPSHCYCDGHATEGGEEMVERIRDTEPLAALVDRARGEVTPRSFGPRIAVVGSRGFAPLEEVSAFVARLPAGTLLVTGDARGVDARAAEVGRALGLHVEVHPAPWRTHGQTAGKLRNWDIVARADALVAFWDGHSPGTAHAITVAAILHDVAPAVLGRFVNVPMELEILRQPRLRQRAVDHAIACAVARGWVAP